LQTFLKNEHVIWILKVSMPGSVNLREQT